MVDLTGLFDFAADVGKRLFGADDDAASKIREMLAAEKTLPVKGLDVAFADGVVTLCGECESAADKEKVVLLAGNVQGVKRVEADKLSAPVSGGEGRYYVVQAGDSLSKIANVFFGNPMEYPKIFEANREVIKDPDLIYPGQKLRIPA